MAPCLHGVGFRSSPAARVQFSSLAPISDVPFAKLQAAGNGYIAIDGRDASCDWGEFTRTITDPHFGVGSAGLLVVENSDIAQLRMRIFNSDGSESKMSGNGIRLFAKFASLAKSSLASGTLSNQKPLAPIGDGLVIENTQAS